MKKNLFKTWLVAIMAMMGAGTGWSQTVTTYDFEDGNALFTADSRVSVDVVEGTQTIYNEAFELDGKAVSFKGASNAQNGYCFAHYDFSALCEQAANVKVEFDALLGNGARSIISVGDASVRGTTGNSSKTTYSNKGAIFRVGTDKSNSYVNADKKGGSTTVSQKWLKVTVEVDETTKTYTYSIEDKATGDILFSNGDEPIAFYSSDATNCTQIDMFGYINNSQMGLIDHLTITVTKAERQQADYTVNFLDKNGQAIKDAVTRSGAVGEAVMLLPADKEPLWNAESTQKYIYESDNTADLIINADGTTVVDIIYRDAEVFNYTVSSSIGTTLSNGSGFEGESLRVGYPRYQLVGNTLYMAAVDNKEYRTTVMLSEDNIQKTVDYTEKEDVAAVFYTEAEDIEGITIATNDNIPVRASNAVAATSTEDVAITTLPAGKYKLHVGIFTSKSSYTDLLVNFGIGSEEFAASFSAVNLNEVASEEYELLTETTISYLASSSADTQFDYIWIEKTGDVEVGPDPIVTPTIANADFSESTPIDNHLCGYGKDMAGNGTTYYGLQDVEGWSKVVLQGDDSQADFPNSGMGGAVFAYGAEWLLKGNQKTAPAAGPDGGEGNCLGFFAVWGCGGYYYQDVTLPAGSYTLTVPMYNQSGTQANESYTGFFVNDSDVKYTVDVNPAVGAWVMQSATFTLDAETTGQIRLGYKSTGSGSGANPMLFIDAVKLQTPLDAAREAYEAALETANAATDDIVTGEENTALATAIAANSNIDITSLDALNAAIEALNAAVAAYNEAKAAYQKLADKKALYVADAEAWPYASEEKAAAVTAAADVTATSAADATEKTALLTKAYRQYVESNGMAEGVATAKDRTSLIANPAAEDALEANVWVTTLGEGSGGSIDIKSAEPWTDGNDNAEHKYFDGGNWGANAWDVTFAQEVQLPTGKYLLTAVTRGSTGVNMTLFAGENLKENLPVESADIANGVFGRGWNDSYVQFEVRKKSTMQIGVRGVTTASHQWMSFSNFRLIYLDRATGIDEVSTNEQQDEAIYNLNGQKVERAGKGIFIIRSAEGRSQNKKVIRK